MCDAWSLFPSTCLVRIVHHFHLACGLVFGGNFTYRAVSVLQMYGFHRRRFRHVAAFRRIRHWLFYWRRIVAWKRFGQKNDCGAFRKNLWTCGRLLRYCRYRYEQCCINTDAAFLRLYTFGQRERPLCSLETSVPHFRRYNLKMPLQNLLDNIWL